LTRRRRWEWIRTGRKVGDAIFNFVCNKVIDFMPLSATIAIRILNPDDMEKLPHITGCKAKCYVKSSVDVFSHGRVDVIWSFHVGILCIPCCSSLSIEECHNILPYKRTSTPLTEPDMKISLIRLFSMFHSSADGQ